MKRTLIIIPTYNEIDNIDNIINTVFSVDKNVNILIVDDNSPDGTGKRVDELMKHEEKLFVLHRENKAGLGRAYIAGFKYAIDHNYDFIFEMDADFSHNPKEIPNFLKELEEYDLVLGSRYAQGVNVINWPLMRLLLSYGANVYTRIITGMPIKDATGGYKAFRREALEGIKLENVSSNGYSFQIEITYKVYNKGFKIKEIPIVFVDRVEGESKMSSNIILEAFFMVWKLKIKKILRIL